MLETTYYRLGAQFVLAVDTAYPWMTFPMLNTYDLYEKNSTENAWWIGLLACIALVWTIVAVAALFCTFCCLKTPRRVEFLLRAWFVASTFGVILHLFCTTMSHRWILVIFSVILRLPYLYMMLVYWASLRKTQSNRAASETFYSI